MRYSLLVSWRNLVRNKKRFIFTLFSLILMKLLLDGALLHLEADIKWLDMIANSS